MGTEKLGPPPANLVAQYTPPDLDSTYVQGMIILAANDGLELTEEELINACAWFLSHPDLGMRYLRELKEERQT